MRLAGPAIAQQVLHTLVFLVDRAMLGHYSPDALASMQISNPVVWTCFGILSAFTVGSVALVGRAVGAADASLASAASRASLGVAAALGSVAGFLGLGALPAILAVFPSAGQAVHAQAIGYLGIALPTMPLLLSSFTAAVVLQAAGDTRTPFLVAALGNVVNVVVSYAFVFGELGAPELGARGAALGSAAAMALQVVVLVTWLLRRNGRVTLRGRGGERDALRRMTKVSSASLGERVLMHAGYLGYVAMIGALGTTAMAANQALMGIEALAFLSADGFGIAAATIVAQRLGAGRPRMAAVGARVALAMAVALLSACAIGFVLAPVRLLGVFSADPEVIALGVPCLWAAAIAQPFMATGVVLSEALRGAGDTRTALVGTFVGGVFVRLVATWVFAFPLGLGFVGAWIGSTVDWIVRTVLFVRAFRAGRWQRARV